MADDAPVTTLTLEGKRGAYASIRVRIFGVTKKDVWTKKAPSFNTLVPKDSQPTGSVADQNWTKKFIDMLQITRKMTITGYIVNDTGADYDSPVDFNGTTLANNELNLRKLFRGGGTISLYISSDPENSSTPLSGMVSNLTVTEDPKINEEGNTREVKKVSFIFEEGVDK